MEVGQTDKILFCKVENDGFDLGAQRRPIDKNDLPKALEIAKTFQKNPRQKIENDQYWTVEKQEIIQSGDYNLSGERYRKSKATNHQKWPMMELGEVCEVFNGITFGKSDYTDQGTIKIIKVKDYDEQGIYFDKDENGWIKQEIKTDKYLQIGDTLIINAAHSVSHVGSKIGYCKFLPFFKCLPSGEVMIARPHKEIKALLLNGIIKSDFFRQKIKGLVKGIHLYPKDVKTIKIPLPPLLVQQEIVTELDGYQKIIDGAKQVVDNYKPQIKIDPEWESKKLERIAEITSSKRIFKSEYVKEGVSFYRTKEIVELNQGKPISLELFISEKHFNKIESKFGVPKKGDILISAVGTIGVSWVIPDKRKFYFKDGNLLWIKNLKGIDPYYLKMVLDNIFTNSTSQLSFGAAYKALTIIKLKQFLIPLPPLKTQKQIIAKIEEEQKLVEANKKLIQLFEQKIKDKIEEVWGEKNGNI